MAKSRRARPRTAHFLVEELEAAWEPFAKMRSCGFSWDGGGYGGTARSSPDHRGLVDHADALEPLLRLAPSGFPCHGRAKAAFLNLKSKYGILEVENRFANRASSLAAEAWRVMAKHVYNMVVDNVPPADAKIRKLMALVQVPAFGASDSTESLDAALGASAPASTGTLVEIPSDDSDGHDDAEVTLCALICRRPSCQKAVYVDDDMDVLLRLRTLCLVMLHLLGLRVLWHLLQLRTL